MIYHRKELNTCRAKLINSLICKCLLFARMQKKCKALHFGFTLRLYTSFYIYRNRSSKTVWFISLRSRLMVPSWFRIIWREMLRPMPEPSFLVVKNGTKICS